MAADIGYMRAYDEAMDKRLMDGERRPAGRAAGDINTRESIAAKSADVEYAPAKAQVAPAKEKGPSSGEGAMSGFMQGAQTGNPYVAAGMAALGVIQAEKKRDAAAFQNKKTGQQNALSQYIDIIGRMA